MLTKRVPVCSAFPTCLKFGALLLLSVWPVAHGQCPQVFSYQKDQSTNQLYGLIELRNLPIGQVVKLNVDISVGVAVPKNNIGSIALVESREQTIRGIYNNQPAQYRVNFPITNVIPKVLTITVNGQTICTGEKAKGKFVTTISHQHKLVVLLQPKIQQIQTPRPKPQTTVPVDVSSGSNIECGKSVVIFNRFSINGKHSPKGQFPWAVPVFINQGGSKKPKYICGSTIISKNHLVTAGHCLYEDNNKRQAADLLTAPGMYNIDNFFEPDIQMGYVASFIVHPDYYTDDDGKTEHDIALMVLGQAIIYNDLVRPICLWNGNDNVEDIVGLTGLVSGWGVTENGSAKKPSYVNAKVVGNEECRSKLGSIFSENDMFCTDADGSVPCTGDSGSGLVLMQGSRFYIRGIVSIGQFDPITLLCDTGKYVIYTDIAPYRFWLKKVMNTKSNK